MLSNQIRIQYRVNARKHYLVACLILTAFTILSLWLLRWLCLSKLFLAVYSFLLNMNFNEWCNNV